MNDLDGKKGTIFGTFYYGNGDKYLGEWLNGKKSGQGVMIYDNGDLYDGEWFQDLFEGQGTYTKDNGDMYHKGMWEKGNPVK